MEFRSGAHSSPRPDLLPESDGLERASVKEKRLEAPLQICRAAVDRVLAENEVRRDDDARKGRSAWGGTSGDGGGEVILKLP